MLNHRLIGVSLLYQESVPRCVNPAALGNLISRLYACDHRGVPARTVNRRLKGDDKVTAVILGVNQCKVGFGVIRFGVVKLCSRIQKQTELSRAYALTFIDSVN